MLFATGHRRMAGYLSGQRQPFSRFPTGRHFGMGKAMLRLLQTSLNFASGSRSLAECRKFFRSGVNCVTPLLCLLRYLQWHFPCIIAIFRLGAPPSEWPSPPGGFREIVTAGC